jgi:hypothetical protein
VEDDPLQSSICLRRTIGKIAATVLDPLGAVFHDSCRGGPPAIGGDGKLHHLCHLGEAMQGPRFFLYPNDEHFHFHITHVHISIKYSNMQSIGFL